MSMDQVYIPVMRVRPYSVTTYSVPHQRPPRTVKQEETKKNLTRGVFKGVISQKSQRSLKLISEGWLLSIQEAKKCGRAKMGSERNYITFVTLTLSAKQQHSDNEIKRELLNNFLINAQRKWGVKEYVWRAEAQKNGNIHFHLFVDKYIHWFFLRNEWNRIQEKLGYLSEFERIHKHRDANSTDIERIRSLKGATNYITKYIAKDSQNRTIEGRLWGCSDDLRKVRSYEVQADGSCYQLLNELRNEKSIRTIVDAHYSVFIGDIRTILKRSSPAMEKELKLHYLSIYKDLYP